MKLHASFSPVWARNSEGFDSSSVPLSSAVAAGSSQLLGNLCVAAKDEKKGWEYSDVALAPRG